MDRVPMQDKVKEALENFEKHLESVRHHHSTEHHWVKEAEEKIERGFEDVKKRVGMGRHKKD